MLFIASSGPCSSRSSCSYTIEKSTFKSCLRNSPWAPYIMAKQTSSGHCCAIFALWPPFEWFMFMALGTGSSGTSSSHLTIEASQWPFDEEVQIPLQDHTYIYPVGKDQQVLLWLDVWGALCGGRPWSVASTAMMAKGFPARSLCPSGSVCVSLQVQQATWAQGTNSCGPPC